MGLRAELLAAVEAVTLRPAQSLGLTAKGRLESGADADITVFDPNAQTAAAAIRHVVVMGHFAVLDHNETGVAAGRPVQHQAIAEVAQSVSPQLVDHDVALPIKLD